MSTTEMKTAEARERLLDDFTSSIGAVINATEYSVSRMVRIRAVLDNAIRSAEAARVKACREAVRAACGACDGIGSIECDGGVGCDFGADGELILVQLPPQIAECEYCGRPRAALRAAFPAEPATTPEPREPAELTEVPYLCNGR